MQRGEWTAFNRIFEENVERLYLYAHTFLKERAAAEDVVQDVFIYLWTNRTAIVLRGSIYAYLLRAVKNGCINYKIKQQTEDKYKNLAVRELMESGEEIDLNELHRKAQAILETLPSGCRKIFILGCVEGMTYQEIAGELNVSVNTVKTQMKIAWKRIRKEMPPHMLALFYMLS